jgi:anti-sigma factor RsiW
LTVSHCDPETLALRSLGEAVGGAEVDTHLATCRQCQEELASLRGLVMTATTGGPAPLSSPAPHVWDRVVAELADEWDATATSSPRATAADEAPLAPVTPLVPRQRVRPATWMLAAAGIGGIVVGGVATAALTSAPSQPATSVEASTALDPLPDWDATGTAELTVTPDGQQVLQVSVETASSVEGGYEEVWLIDRDVKGMVSLGPLQGSSGSFVIPEGVDVSDFPIVDVSLEPPDGEPTHSGNSIVRGTLDA